MLIKTAAAAALLTIAAAPTWAVNKCTGPDGAVVFQDAPCAGKGEAIKVSPAMGSGTAQGSPDGAARARAELAAVNRRAETRAAIERGEPLVGMTEAELQQAMGDPNRANLANYNGTQHNQLIYERGARTWYVYTDGGVVRSIQNTASIAGQRRASVRCLSPMEIRSMETSASSITLSEEERVQRRKEIAAARACQ